MELEGTRRRVGAAVLAVMTALPAGAVLATRDVAAASFAQFTSVNMGGDNSPTWSNDGQSVYYTSRLGGFPYIYKKAASAPMNQTGTRLTGWTIEEFSASESGDGQWVVIAARDTIGKIRLWRCPSSGGAPLTPMTVGPFDDFTPHWWGSGPTQEIVFVTTRGGAGYQIATLKPNGTEPATEMTLVTGPGNQDFEPCFSPDGQQIVFSSDRTGTRQLFVTTRVGQGWGAPVQLTTGTGDKENAAFSPSGLTIAYQKWSGNSVSLWFMNADGTNAREVADGSGSYDADPSFSPATSQMAFTSDRTGASYIWLINDLSTPAESASWGRLKSTYRR